MRSIILDFDGVLFNSALEAHAVCENIPKKWGNVSLKTFTFDEFMKFRSRINNSEDFLKYYLNEGDFNENLKEAFKKKFYKSREILREEKNYIQNYYPPYEFFGYIREMINAQPNSFYILSTRDEGSIKATLDEYVNFAENNIFGQAAYAKEGSKLNVLKANKLALNECLYLDDLCSHLYPFITYDVTLMQANWGYGDLDPEYCVDANTAFQNVLGWLDGA